MRNAELDPSLDPVCDPFSGDPKGSVTRLRIAAHDRTPGHQSRITRRPVEVRGVAMRAERTAGPNDKIAKAR